MMMKAKQITKRFLYIAYVNHLGLKAQHPKLFTAKFRRNLIAMLVQNVAIGFTNTVFAFVVLHHLNEHMTLYVKIAGSHPLFLGVIHYMSILAHQITY